MRGICGVAAIFGGLGWTVVIGAAQPAGTSQAVVQPISYFKLAPDVNGFVSVAADPSGVYAFTNASVRRYDSLGNELWTQTFDAAGFVVGAASDNAGVYVLAQFGSSAPCSLQRFTVAGTRSWSRDLSVCSSIGADTTGAYVLSRTNGSGVALVKYAPDNTVLWTHDLGAVGPPTGRMAVDVTGVYFITGNPVALSMSAPVTAHKWSASGVELWTRPLRKSDLARDIVADGTGFDLMAMDLPQGRTVLRRYDSAGAELWSHAIDPEPDPNLSRIAADGTGVYVAARIAAQGFATLPGQCKSGSGSDSYVIKYDPATGEEIWAREFGTSQAAWAYGVAVAAGAVYVAGQEGAAQVQDDFEHFDAFRPANPTRAGFLARFEAVPAAAAGPRPRIFPDCVVNAASYLGGGIAPREIVTIFGAEMGPSDLVPLHVTPDARLDNALAGTRVLFNGVAAPLLYVSAGQVSAIVPTAVAGSSTADVQVEYNGVRSPTVTVPVLDARPGIFSVDGSGEGQAAIWNEDGTLNSPVNPAPRGSVITLYATGGAETAANVQDGQILDSVLPRINRPVWIFFDLGTSDFPLLPKAAQIQYAGGVPKSVAGLLQINFRVPADAVTTGGRVPFLMIIGSHWTVYQVSVALK